MDRLSEFKKERSVITRHSALPVDAARAKFEANDREIKGYPIIWNSKNDFDELVMKGATLNSINARGVGSTAGNKITILLHHNQRQPLCLPAELYEDDYGLFFRAVIDEDISYCDDTVASVRQGTLSQLSYGFNYVWDDNKTVYDADLDAFVLREIYLWEISLVTFSSDENAQLRSYRERQMNDILSRYTKEEITDLQNLLSLSQRAATSTPNEDEGGTFNKLLKLI
jgi:HK97 family phage prohead protease